MSSTDIIDTTIFNLRTIGKLQKGNKVNIHHALLTVSEPTITQGIERLYAGENRLLSTQGVINTIKTAIGFVELLMESTWLIRQPGRDYNLKASSDNDAYGNDSPPLSLASSPASMPNMLTRQFGASDEIQAIRREQFKRLSHNLVRSLNGVDNLCNTYNDETVTNMLETTKKKIVAVIKRITEFCAQNDIPIKMEDMLENL